MLADAYERAFTGVSRRPSLTFLGAEGEKSSFRVQAEELRIRCDRGGWQLLTRTRDPRPAFHAARLVVVPSMRPEPFGNVILEALASGCRVLAFGGGGVDDLAPRFPGALQVVERGLEPLATALRDWWQNGCRAQSPAEWTASLAVLETDYTSNAASGKWEELLQRLTA